jgi:hypothetical protein
MLRRDAISSSESWTIVALAEKMDRKYETDVEHRNIHLILSLVTDLGSTEKKVRECYVRVW